MPPPSNGLAAYGVVIMESDEVVELLHVGASAAQLRSPCDALYDTHVPAGYTVCRQRPQHTSMCVPRDPDRDDQWLIYHGGCTHPVSELSATSNQAFCVSTK